MFLLTRVSHLGWFALLGCLSVGCAVGSTSRAPGGPTSPRDAPPLEELSRFVLLLHAAPVGGATPEWRRAETLDLSAYRRHARDVETRGSVVFAAMRPRDCHAELQDCVSKCMSRPLPRGYGHMTHPGRGQGAKAQYCREECWRPYRDCEESQGREAHAFSAVDEAEGGLAGHARMLLVGGLVIIAGVVFVVVSAGAGVLVLVPAVLLSDRSSPSFDGGLACP